MKKIYRILSHITFGKLSLYFRSLYTGEQIPKNNNIFVYETNGECHRVKKIRGIKINFFGSNSCVKLYKPFWFYDCEINIGNNNEIVIQKDSEINRLKIPMKMSDNSKLIIGKNFFCGVAVIFLHDEPDRLVEIDDNCMFSSGIMIWPSDGHTITDMDGNILNKPKNIHIGKNVWVGINTTILKGAKIPDGSIIGACSLYTKSSNPETDQPCIFVGHPAKVIKQGNFNWDRCNTYAYERKRND